MQLIYSCQWYWNIFCRYDFHYDSLHKHLYNVFFLGSQPTGFLHNLLFKPQTFIQTYENFSQELIFRGQLIVKKFPTCLMWANVIHRIFRPKLVKVELQSWASDFCQIFITGRNPTDFLQSHRGALIYICCLNLITLKMIHIMDGTAIC